MHNVTCKVSKVNYTELSYRVYAQTPLTRSDMDHTVLPANNTISAIHHIHIAAVCINYSPFKPLICQICMYFLVNMQLKLL